MEPGGGFHRNEAISAVQDEEQFYGEDDDFDDLYNDVNVGEGFLHRSLHANDGEQGGFPRGEVIRSEPPPPPPAPLPPPLAIAGEPKAEKPPDKSAGFSEAVFRGPGERAPPDGARLGQPSGRPGEIQGLDGRNDREAYPKPGGGTVYGAAGIGGNSNGGGSGGVVGGTTLFVGDLHWWTTDADLEVELCKYGQVKEIKFFDEKASGKSKGYCQVEFFDPMAAAACKEGMDGQVFNGRPCVVALASPFAVRRMGEAQVNKSRAQAMGAQPQSALDQKGRGGGGGAQIGGNYGRGGGGGGSGRGWERGGMGGRGSMGNMRNRMGPMGGRGIMGNGGGIVAPPPPVLPPGAMLGQGFDPTGYGVAMGRMGAGYGGFPTGPSTAPFPGMLPSFPPIVAPHVNPAFFGRGMQAGGIGMWPDPSMGVWGGEDQSSYGEDVSSDRQYGEGSHGKDRGSDWDRPGVSDRRHDRDKDMGPGQEWSERRHPDRDDREREREREMQRERNRDREQDRYKDDRDRHADHYRNRDREPERGDDWDRGRSSRARSNPREIEHGKRRRPSE